MLLYFLYSSGRIHLLVNSSVVEPEAELKPFYNKFLEIHKLFPCNTAYYVKRQNNFQKYS
jgi:hypothetical protein